MNSDPARQRSEFARNDVQNHGPSAPGAMMLQVRYIRQETADALSLVFGRGDIALTDAGYRPGQFLTLRIPKPDGTFVARCYSLSSCPFTDDDLKITVKRIDGGYASNWLCDNVGAGALLEVLPPSGIFGPKDLSADLLLVAAGSGITPIMSILRSALQVGRGQISLLYVNRDEASTIFAADLRYLASTYSERLKVIHWFSGLLGRLTKTELQRITIPFCGNDSFICGPPAFMTMVRKALLENGTPATRIFTEEFKSLSGDPFEATAFPSPSLDRQSSVRLDVDLYGEQHSFAWPKGTILLDLLLSKGLDAPNFCREGACHTCTCTLVAGQVGTLTEGVIDASGSEVLILACQSVASGEAVKIKFSDTL